MAKKAAASKRATPHQKSKAVSAPAPSQKDNAPSDMEGLTISRISIRLIGHEDGVDEARLRSHMFVREGESYHIDALDEDIKALYSSGMVEDLRLLAEPDGKAIGLIYEITPRGELR